MRTGPAEVFVTSRFCGTPLCARTAVEESASLPRHAVTPPRVRVRASIEIEMILDLISTPPIPREQLKKAGAD
jgi:hypothetical protein